jgi:hypothetical protein
MESTKIKSLNLLKIQLIIHDSKDMSIMMQQSIYSQVSQLELLRIWLWNKAKNDGKDGDRNVEPNEIIWANKICEHLGFEQSLPYLWGSELEIINDKVNGD